MSNQVASGRGMRSSSRATPSRSTSIKISPALQHGSLPKLRITGNTFQPKVLGAGNYDIIISADGKTKTLTKQSSEMNSTKTITINL